MNPADVPPLVLVLAVLAFAVIGFTAALEWLGVLDEHVGSPDWHPGDPPDYSRHPCGERSCTSQHPYRPWQERMR